MPLPVKKKASDDEKEEITYEIDGETFTEKNLLDVIIFNEKFQNFNVLGFLQVFFYHCIYNFMTPILGNLIILLAECGNPTLQQNMGFLRITNMLEMIQFLVSITSSAGLAILIYGVITGQIDYPDYIEFIILIIGRQIVTSAKYGFYKREHYKIVRGAKMGPRLLQLNLSLANEMLAFDLLSENVDIELEAYQMHPDMMKIQVLKRTEQIANTSGYMRCLRPRLLDNSLESIRERYASGIEDQRDNEDEIARDKFLKVFDEKNFDKRSEVPDYLKKMDQLVNIQELDEVEAKTLFVEIYLQANEEATGVMSIMMYAMMFTMLMCGLPYLYRYYKKEDMFKNQLQFSLEMVILFPKFIIIILNFVLVSLLAQHLEKRTFFRQKFVQLVDSGMSEYYQTPRALPQLYVYDVMNLSRIRRFFKLVTVFQKKFFNRSVVYSTAILYIYLFQAAYLGLLVILAKQPIPPAFEFFAISGFINATVFSLLYYNAMQKGAEANETIIRLQKSINELKMGINGEIGNFLKTGEFYRLAPEAEYSLEAMVERRANNCFWMKEIDEGKRLFDMNTERVYDASSYVKIKEDELEDLSGPLIEVLENFQEDINFHIENEQYSAMGAPMTSEAAESFLSTFFSFIIAFMQELFFGGA